MEIYWLLLYVVVWQVIFGKIISEVFRDWCPEDTEMVLFDSIYNPIKLHAHGF